ncbi:putative basic helix-loop-helix protein BHLH22 [Sesbania bispinosa]|nr:putative basic helix-loop-helix protein BHLH22 [Sesbania bispinosa]
MVPSTVLLCMGLVPVPNPMPIIRLKTILINSWNTLPATGLLEECVFKAADGLRVFFSGKLNLSRYGFDAKNRSNHQHHSLKLESAEIEFRRREQEELLRRREWEFPFLLQPVTTYVPFVENNEDKRKSSNSRGSKQRRQNAFLHLRCDSFDIEFEVL